jgi:hypothetical protein
MSQAAVAAMMNTQQSSVSDLEAGRNCTRETFHRYVEALGVRLTETITYEDDLEGAVALHPCDCPQFLGKMCTCGHAGDGHSPFHPHWCYHWCRCKSWEEGA